VELDDVSVLMREEIAHFFSIYKDFEPGRVTAIEGWADRAAAEAEIQQELARAAIEPAAAD
jgi:inorganic pyrophosphatase